MSSSLDGPVHWGFIGCGRIANDFAIALRSLGDKKHLLVAVATHDSQERASDFADHFSTPSHKPRAYDSYEKLCNDANVSIVYVNTTHNFHFDNVRAALQAGKHVLCEKPMTLNTAQAKELVKLAHDTGLFLMEAMWTRFFPVMDRLRHLVSSGEIGEVVSVHADFGFLPSAVPPIQRYVDPNLAGGCLLDIGVYAISFASMVFGGKAAMATTALAHLNENGVDDYVTMSIKYADNQFAQLMCSFQVASPSEATVIGTKGYVRIHGRFSHADHLTLTLLGQPASEEYYSIPDYLDELNSQRSDGKFEFNFDSKGMIWEAEEVRTCLKSKRLESSVMPLNETLQILSAMDRIRDQIKVLYPAER